MKVLIMEDEVQIREGLRTEIFWEKYGIDEVYTARNGEIGYEMAKKIRPEIILTDIRMPKMDGISAVKKLKAILPDCSIIFISAYPEKNYFKEAIRLKAVSFVEKPIDREELDKVLQEAVSEQRQCIFAQEQKKRADLYNCQQLVNRLCRNQFTNKEECRRLLREVGLDGDSYTFFACVIVSHTKEEGAEEYQWNQFYSMLIRLEEVASVRILIGQNQSQQMVCHTFMKKEEQYEKVLQWLKQEAAAIPRCNLLAGSIQNSYMKLHESYKDTAILMNKAFYSDYGEIVYTDCSEIVMTLDMSAWKAEFTEQLAQGKPEAILELLEKYKESILEHRRMHYTKIRELYLYMYGELNRYMEKKAILLNEEKESLHMHELFLKNGNYEELHLGIVKLAQRIFEAGASTEDELVVHIKKYIMANYQNPWLSIKEIADAAGKSVSYTCVMFKKETGITLNQYLTEVRLEASKIFLGNSRNNIRTVAEKCGYTDSSYYARAFKKYTGVKPSDYRGVER